MKKILSALSICLVVLCSFFLTACGEQKSTPTSVMTMSVNPEVQFVLDQNNKVVNVTATNEDGEKLIALMKEKAVEIKTGLADIYARIGAQKKETKPRTTKTATKPKKEEKTEKQKDAVEICFERIRAELMKKDEIIAELQAKIKKLESAQNMNYQKSMPDQTLSYKQAA